jgi:thiosulfate/3-mercaptopyruvate sulfurtransferase
MQFERHRVKLGLVDFRTTIDAAAALHLIGSPSVVFLDCRFDLAAPDAGKQAYLRERIPTARYVDLNRDLSGPISPATGRHPLPRPERLAVLLGGLGVSPGTQVIAYDEINGSFAARAWWLLRWLGHDRAAVLDGGLQAWLEAGGAVETGEPGMPPRAAAFAPRPDAAAVITAAELVEALEDRRRLVVDARAPERFAGTVEPIDPVAGHVPGAINHPFTANLREDGRFLPEHELARRWRERLAGTAPADVIAMCGSGVTACHDLLALELAGLPGAKLYAGSWSEWIRDPKRPIARG